MIKRFAPVLLAILVLLSLPMSTVGDETSDVLNRNRAGLNYLRTAPVPKHFQNVHIGSGVDSVLTVNLKGTTTGLTMGLVWVPGATGTPDTVWAFYPNYDAKTDSSYFVAIPGTSDVFWFGVPEGDKIRIDKNSAGASFGFVMGVGE